MDLFAVGEDLKHEEKRLQTFSRWSSAFPIDPHALAKSGFAYLGPSDRVKCVFCHGILKSWMPGDDPAVEHRKHFPHCAFIKGRPVGNVAIEGTSSPGPKRQCQIPQYADKNTRLETLSDLPPSVTLDKDVLADAGFFYTGHGDSVRCFSCDGALQSWQHDDDPWIEHARWFPRCSYLRQEKGDLFVDEIVTNFRSSQLQVPISPQRESPSPSRKFEDLSLAVQAVVDMGYKHADVQRVYLDLKRLKGPTSQINAQTLMTAVMKDQETRDEEQPSVAAPSTSSAEDRILCKICMEREVEETFLPCGHLVTCEKCSQGIKSCPVCRQTIRGCVRTFLS